MRIAMVCLGNICRSPMAAAVAEDLIARAGLDSRVEVDSFGTARYHVGEGADLGAVAALHRHGWAAKPHRARQLKVDDIKAADLVLCADRSNLHTVKRLAASAGEDPSKVRLLRSFDPGRRAGDDEVPDPWGGGDQEFDRALAAIEPSCEGLVRELAARLAV